MVGLGTWYAEIKSFLLSASCTVTIKDNNGSYEFEFDSPDADKIAIDNIRTKESGNSLTVTFNTGYLPGKDIVLFAEFGDDTVTGYIDVPLLGKIKLLNGRRIS